MKKLLAAMLLLLLGALIACTQSDSPLTVTDEGLYFQTELVGITLNRTDGAVAQVTELATGSSLLGDSDVPWFVYFIDADGNLSVPQAMSVRNGKLQVRFENRQTAQFKIEAFDSFFTIELISAPKVEAYELFFGNIPVDPTLGWCSSSVAMTTNATPFELPGGNSFCSVGYTLGEIGADGAKLAVSCTKESDHRESLKAAMLQIDPQKGVLSTKGGAWAMDAPEAYGDYVIADTLSAETATELASLANAYSVDQIYVHQGERTFIQASFTFPSALTEQERQHGMTGDAALFRSRISQPLAQAGVSLALHTYSSLVPAEAEDILTNPRWQKQLCAAGKYTLAQRITTEDLFLPTTQSAGGAIAEDAYIPWNDTRTAYLLIDEEIVLAEAGQDGGFVLVARGQLGTQPSAHKKGAEIRQLGGQYGMFQPIPGSDLFYEVARRTGDACEAGGFDLIYLDGLESITAFVPLGTEWYYYAEFIRTILSYCTETPVLDYSTFCPATWNAQGRDGGVDAATRAYKTHAEQHTAYNLLLNDAYIPTARGWFHCAPDMDESYKNTIVKTMFRDDLDRQGVLSLAYGMPISYNLFSLDTMDGQSRLAENTAYLSLYAALRKAGYFDDSVLAALQNLQQEYRLTVMEDGSFGFTQMHYAEAEFEQSGEMLQLSNPYGSQTLLLRLEQRFSSLGEGARTVLVLDETAALSTLAGEHAFDAIDLSQHGALRVSVYGTGSTTDALLISLRSPVLVEGGRTDFLLPLSHSGWKDFWLIDSDCGDYGSYSFDVACADVDYECFRALPDMSQITSVTLTLCGSCDGARIDDITACKLTDGTVTNPSLTVNGQTVVFDATLQGGEYIEYDVASACAYLCGYTKESDGTNGRTAFRREISLRGGITVPSGTYSLTYSAQTSTAAPARARVTVGTAGALLQNSDARAPQVSISSAAAEVWQLN